MRCAWGAAAMAAGLIHLLGCGGTGSGPLVMDATADYFGVPLASDTGASDAVLDKDAGYTGAPDAVPDAVADGNAGCVGFRTCQTPMACSGTSCTWTGALGNACPKLHRPETVSMCAGLYAISAQGIDTSGVDYYSADGGELVWTVSCVLGECNCNGPNPPPCDLFATCVADDSLCAPFASSPDAGPCADTASCSGGDVCCLVNALTNAVACQTAPCPPVPGFGIPVQLCSTAAECFTAGDICAPLSAGATGKACIAPNDGGGDAGDARDGAPDAVE